VKEVGVSELVADQTVEYLATAQTALGAMPTAERLVMERFFDEAATCIW
jgi:ATP-dependent Lhr-like helicase